MSAGNLAVGDLNKLISASMGTGTGPQAHGLVVRCFGYFEVLRDGQVVHDWRRDKAKTLLKLLVAHRGSIQRDVLLELLWPELDPEAAAGNLRVTLYALRRALASGSGRDSVSYVLTRGEVFELNPHVPVWIDTQAFRALYELAGSLWRRGQVDEAVRAYEAVEALYRDDYLVGDLYEEWTIISREQFKDQYLLVVSRLAEAAFSRGDYEACIEYSHKILARDAFREDAYEQLMRCHVEMGRPARALRWFEVCREALERELNTPPGERVMELAQQISSARTVEPRQLPLKPEDRPAGPVRGDNWTSWAAPYARVISPLPTSTRRLGVVASTA